MAILKCKMCGGTIEFENGATVGVCDSCGTKQTLPKLDDDKRAQLFDRANMFRRDNEFDKAMGIYEIVLSEDNTDAEAYWGIVLCKYGIEYVEDPKSHKRIPTVNRAQYTTIFDDENYKSALENADALQRELYEAEAKSIDTIQKGILEISEKEEPFDVFICYKETDINGRRTKDSVLAQNIYNELSSEGYKVFFSRITLEDKLGSAYEPYIFAALHSSKVMLVVGTNKDYFNAVWVKNEWSRYLGLINQGEKKTLIPLYDDIDPKDLPEEFGYIQAQDMSKVGFIQDLIRGIKKLISSEEQANYSVKQSVNRQIIDTMKVKAEKALQEKDWNAVIRACENILDYDENNQDALLMSLLAKNKVEKLELLKKNKKTIISPEFKKLESNGTDEIKEALKKIKLTVKKRQRNTLITISTCSVALIMAVIFMCTSQLGQYYLHLGLGYGYDLFGDEEKAIYYFGTCERNDLIYNIKKEECKELVALGRYSEAYNAYYELDTNESIAKGLELLTRQCYIPAVGDVIYFGRTTDDESKLLQWIVISKENGYQLLSKESLITLPMIGSKTMINSLDEFMEFSTEEAQYLGATKELLSYYQATKMLDDEVLQKYLCINEGWWLSSKSVVNYKYVDKDGNLIQDSSYSDEFGVRPVIWLSITENN